MKKRHLQRALANITVTSGKDFHLRDHDPAAVPPGLTAETAEARLADGVARLSKLQERLYAQGTWSVLCVFQAIDAAGKDGTIKHVMSGVNPQGVQVHSFKAPGADELAHDFLWRVWRELPPRGHIGIFNRSHYEEVLVTRLHPEILQAQGIPPSLLGKKLWRHRMEDIAGFEQYLGRQGCLVLKFFLHISKDEQKRRFLERMNTPDKTWKIAPSDLAERGRWADYMAAYEEAVRATATPEAPWFIVPANHKWAARLLVVEAMVQAMEALDLQAPEPSKQDQAWIAEARRKLEQED